MSVPQIFRRSYSGETTSTVVTESESLGDKNGTASYITRGTIQRLLIKLLVMDKLNLRPSFPYRLSYLLITLPSMNVTGKFRHYQPDVLEHVGRLSTRIKTSSLAYHVNVVALSGLTKTTGLRHPQSRADKFPQNLKWVGTLMQSVPEIFEKYRSQFTKTHHLKREIISTNFQTLSWTNSRPGKPRKRPTSFIQVDVRLI